MRVGRGRAGMALLETVMGAFLFALILYAVIALQPSAVLGIRKSHDLVAASGLAQRCIEQARGAPFETLEEGRPAPVEETVNGTAFHVQPEYTRTSDDVMRLRVTVTWDTGPRAQKDSMRSSLTYETRFFHYVNP